LSNRSWSRHARLFYPQAGRGACYLRRDRCHLRVQFDFYHAQTSRRSQRQTVSRIARIGHIRCRCSRPPRARRGGSEFLIFFRLLDELDIRLDRLRIPPLVPEPPGLGWLQPWL
jgi:hypothetical protein